MLKLTRFPNSNSAVFLLIFPQLDHKPWGPYFITFSQPFLLLPVNSLPDNLKNQAEKHSKCSEVAQHYRSMLLISQHKGAKRCRCQSLEVLD